MSTKYPWMRKDLLLPPAASAVDVSERKVFAELSCFKSISRCVIVEISKDEDFAIRSGVDSHP